MVSFVLNGRGRDLPSRVLKSSPPKAEFSFLRRLICFIVVNEGIARAQAIVKLRAFLARGFARTLCARSPGPARKPSARSPGSARTPYARSSGACANALRAQPEGPHARARADNFL